VSQVKEIFQIPMPTETHKVVEVAMQVQTQVKNKNEEMHQDLLTAPPTASMLTMTAPT